MASINSITFFTRAGQGTISITHSSIASGRTFEVAGITSISAEFDLEEDSNNATSVLFDFGEFEFSAHDRMDDGSSLFETLDAISATDIIEVSLAFTTKGGTAINDKYEFFIEDMEYDRIERTTSIKGLKKDLSALDGDIGAFITGLDASLKETFNITGSPDAVDAKTFILEAIDLLNTNNTNQNLSPRFGFDGKTSPRSFIVPETADGAISGLLLRMAAAEGSVIGSMMGVNFFVGRTEQTGVTLSENDVIKLTIQPGLDVYFSIDNEFNGVGAPWANWTSIDSKTFNQNAIKTLSVFFTTDDMARATWNSSTLQYDDLGGEVNGVAIDGIFGYASAYGANKARRIELEVLGVDTVKPYQSFTLDTSFPALVQNQTFRASSLDYDLQNDIIKIEAYRI